VERVVAEMVTCKWSGLSELGRAFLALPTKLQNGSNSPMRSGVAAAATIFRDAARANVAYDPSQPDPHVRDRIIIARDRDAPSDTERYVVMVAYRSKKYRHNRLNKRLGRVGKSYADYGDLFYWRFLEFGNSRQPAQAFMRPAFDAHIGQAMEQFKFVFAYRLPGVVAST
jgi:HK97 gp10 family phage protein